MTRPAPASATSEIIKDRLRRLLMMLDANATERRAIDAEITRLGRAYVEERGEFMAPTVERLRRDLSA